MSSTKIYVNFFFRRFSTRESPAILNANTYALLNQSPSSGKLDSVNRFFVNSNETSFLGSASSMESYTKLIRNYEHRPQVAFIGRSNSGKSSLINSITNRSNLVRTSKRPGHTRTINFFDIRKSLLLVDLPGYGYGSKTEWLDFVTLYISQSSQLKRLYVLIDARVGIKELDHDGIAFYERYTIPYQLILTKIDKLNHNEINSCLENVSSYLKKLHCASPDLIAVSALKDINIPLLRWSILESTGHHR